MASVDEEVAKDINEDGDDGEGFIKYRGLKRRWYILFLFGFFGSMQASESVCKMKSL